MLISNHLVTFSLRLQNPSGLSCVNNFVTQLANCAGIGYAIKKSGFA